MSDAFTKLFAQMLDSTVWGEQPATCKVWITMLLMADAKGRVMASVPGLARRAVVSIAETQTALECFLSPDPFSRTPDNEGRRIEAIDGGWQLLNYAKFREKRSAVDRADYQREWDRTYRGDRPNAAHRQSDNPRQPPTTPDETRPKQIAEAYVEQKQDQEQAPQRRRGARLPQDWQPDPEALGTAAKERPDLHLPTVVASFRDYWHAKAGKDAAKLDWTATFRNWVRNQRGSSNARAGPPTGPPKVGKVRQAYDAIGDAIERMNHGGQVVSSEHRARDTGLLAHGAGRAAGHGNVATADRDLDG